MVYGSAPASVCGFVHESVGSATRSVGSNKREGINLPVTTVRGCMQVYRSTREKKQDFLHLVWTGVDPSQARKRLRVDKAQALRWMQGIEDKTPKVQSRESVVLAIPDMHHPFCHQDALDFLKYVKGRFNPTTVVCLGDEIDAHAFSRYMPDPDGMSPGKELAAAIEGLMPFYREFPKVLVCESNHTVRPWKKAFEAGLPAAFLPSYSKLLNAPDGWVWKSRHVVDGVMYIHGDSGKSGAYAHQNYVKAFKKSVVIGHMHSNAGVQYDGHHFGLNTGCLIDADAYAFKYAKNMPTGVNLGCGLIIGGECAFFLPMRTDEHGRWIGRL